MTTATQTQISADWIQNSHAQTRIAGRDIGIDTMRGIAILMVIGIHSMPQPLDPFWGKLVDAALRPCVPIFLFASGYLTALSGRVVLGRRVKTALIPYAIAFVAAYIYMAWHNPAMDHRITTTIARFVLAYVFVYYYVFVYIGCTVCLWLIFRISDAGSPISAAPGYSAGALDFGWTSSSAAISILFYSTGDSLNRSCRKCVSGIFPSGFPLLHWARLLEPPARDWRSEIAGF